MYAFNEILSKVDYVSTCNTKEIFDKAHSGDIEARNEIVCNNLKLIYKHVTNYIGQGLDVESLFAAGVEGLMRAIDKYDPSSGNAFSTYAVFWIKDFISQEVMRNRKVVHIPINVTKAYLQVKKAQRELVNQLEEEPTIVQIAQHMDKTVESVDKLLQLDHHGIDIDDDDDHAESSWLSIKDESFKEFSNNLDDKNQISKMLSILTPKEKLFVELRYGLINGVELSIDEVAKCCACSKQRVSAGLISALRKMKKS